ncbi:pachytene checkpoint protein 2 homolog [Cimex lectularius]|uniref:AAA+ ATPase domain-containing protein n=1 Tax=Cimex lectularius TaxID=79782 RepID=A0A8I6RAM0_CIMLE|nr:pachytene checkpoint protein 2 homolog [Cimex lectularius]
MISNLNIEVVVKENCPLKNEALISSVKNELNGKIVQLADKITNFDLDVLTQHVEYIRICEFFKCPSNQTESDSSKCQEKKEKDSITLVSDLLKIYFLRLNNEGPQSETISAENDDTLVANFTLLPSSYYDGLWEALIFDSNIKDNLLQYAQAMLRYSKCGVDPTIVSCNRVVLLHGPPGTGKTSLCKALAQKLSIRLSHAFSHAILIDINTHSLFSKYFSESGKLVAKMFDKIRELAFESKTLVCVLVDEVESLTHCRETTRSGSEPSDALRVVNAVLTNLDNLSHFSNVITFTTSNITKAIDRAFVDRADLRVLIPNPSPYGIYSIYYSCLKELVQKGLIIGPLPEKIRDKETFENFSGCDYIEGTKLLIELSKDSYGLSGRTLRKVPLRVHATMIHPEALPLFVNFLKSMFLAVKVIKEEVDKFTDSHITLQ